MLFHLEMKEKKVAIFVAGNCEHSISEQQHEIDLNDYLTCMLIPSIKLHITPINHEQQQTRKKRT